MSRLQRYVQQLAAVSAIDTAGIPVGPTVGCDAEWTICYVRFGAGTSAGAVVLEEASDPAYTGTWSNIGTVAWSAITKEGVIRFAGNFRAIRARVSVGVVGGTVDAWIQISG